VGEKIPLAFRNAAARLAAMVVICCMEGVFFTLTLKLPLDAAED
jgi:hypothetical protein